VFDDFQVRTVARLSLLTQSLMPLVTAFISAAALSQEEQDYAGFRMSVPGLTIIVAGTWPSQYAPLDLAGTWWAMCQDSARLRRVTLKRNQTAGVCTENIRLGAEECPAVVLIRGAAWARDKLVSTASLEQTTNRKIAVSFEDHAWSIQEQRKGESGFELLLNGDSKQQILYSTNSTDDGGWGVSWAGDLDGDHVPDLVLSASHKYSVRCQRVFLSSYAQVGPLVREVAVNCGGSC
jgi:hypothetical protein